MRNLKKIRKEKGYTCESLGELLNVKKATVSKYERNEIQPSKDVLIRLAEIFNCTIDYLLDRTDIRNYETHKSDKTLKNVLNTLNSLKAEHAKLDRQEFKCLTEDEINSLANVIRVFKQL